MLLTVSGIAFHKSTANKATDEHLSIKKNDKNSLNTRVNCFAGATMLTAFIIATRLSVLFTCRKSRQKSQKHKSQL